MADETLLCEDCQKPFVWTEKDQGFYARNNFSTPKRCKPCREERKKAFENRAQGNPEEGGKEMVCETCGGTFIWSKKDQDFYAKKQFTPPKHCRICREKRKKDRDRNKRRRPSASRDDARSYVE